MEHDRERLIRRLKLIGIDGGPEGRIDAAFIGRHAYIKDHADPAYEQGFRLIWEDHLRHTVAALSAEGNSGKEDDENPVEHARDTRSVWLRRALTEANGRLPGPAEEALITRFNDRLEQAVSTSLQPAAAIGR